MSEQDSGPPHVDAVSGQAAWLLVQGLILRLVKEGVISKETMKQDITAGLAFSQKAPGLKSCPAIIGYSSSAVVRHVGNGRSYRTPLRRSVSSNRRNMIAMSDQISFACADCGSDTFTFERNPPKDDDIVTCAGCGKKIGRYADVRREAMKGAKAEVAKMASNIFGKNFRKR